jgi:hypothetical protein
MSNAEHCLAIPDFANFDRMLAGAVRPGRRENPQSVLMIFMRLAGGFA